MKKYAIVTDSTTYFKEEVFEQYGIKRASLNIIDGDTSYRELEVDNSLVYKLFDEGKRLTTSQPAPGEFLQIYEELLEHGYEKIFVLLLSEKLSGTYQSAKIALNMLDDPNKVHLFESNMAAFGNEMLLLHLIDFIEQDKDYDFIVNKINGFISNTGLIITNEDLISLIRSGRLSKTKAMIGKILHIKPVVKMEHGKLDLLTSSRTVKKALEHIVEYMKNKVKKDYNKLYVRVISHNSMESAQKLIEEIKSIYHDAEITLAEYIGPVFNVHVGPKGFGVSWTTE
jgi:DegV family protein with EDD domain